MFLSKISPREIIEKLKFVRLVPETMQSKCQESLTLEAPFELPEIDKSRFVKLRTSQSTTTEPNSTIKRNGDKDRKSVV